MRNLKSLSIIGLFICVHFVQPLIAQTIDLGTFSATNIDGNFHSNNLPAEEAFNGIARTFNDGWLGYSIANQSLTFDFNLKENTDFDSDRYNTVQLTLNIWSGSINNRRGLEQFEIRVADPGGSLNQASPITDFTSFSGDKLPGTATPSEDDTAIAMSLNSDTGLFSTETLIIYQGFYTIVFNVPSTTERFRLRMPASETFTDYFSIEEVQLSGTIPVPEPSSFALLLASGMVLFVGLRHKSARKLQSKVREKD